MGSWGEQMLTPGKEIVSSRGNLAVLPVIQLFRRLKQYLFFSSSTTIINQLTIEKKNKNKKTNLPETVLLKLLLNPDGIEVHTINFGNYSLFSKATILQKNVHVFQENKTDASFSKKV